MAGGTTASDLDTYIEFDFTREYTISRLVIEGIREETAACQKTHAGATINYCNKSNGRDYSIEIGSETSPNSGTYTWTSCIARTDLPFGATSTIVVPPTSTSSNHVDVLCTAGVAGSKLRLRR